MNRKVWAIVSVLAMAMIALPITAVFADSPMIEVKGTITSTSSSSTTIKEVGQNIFIFRTTTSTWSGDISGSTTGSQTWISHLQGGSPPPGIININVEIVFSTATVAGRTGTMTVEMNMLAYPPDPSMSHGTWRIKDAAGGLEGLHGEGVWLSAPNRYEGKVHFSK